MTDTSIEGALVRTRHDPRQVKQCIFFFMVFVLERLLRGKYLGSRFTAIASVSIGLVGWHSLQ